MKNSYLKGKLVFDKSLVRAGDIVDITLLSGKKDRYCIVSTTNRSMDVKRLADNVIKCIDTDDIINGDIIIDHIDMK